MTKEEVERRTILRCTAGSELYGTSLNSADRDEVGVCIETVESLVGFTGFEQFIQRDAAIREGRHDAPSRPGDLDLKVFGLRKFVKLAADGNPSVLEILFAPSTACSVLTYRGRQLQSLADLFVSKRAIRKYLGYMTAQRERMLGTRGQKDVNRKALVDAHGYDTKYAAHMLRLGWQGYELLTTGRVQLPMTPHSAEALLRVRRGEVSLEKVLADAEYTESLVAEDLEKSSLRETADLAAIEAWLVDVYLTEWARDRRERWVC